MHGDEDRSPTVRSFSEGTAGSIDSSNDSSLRVNAHLIERVLYDRIATVQLVREHIQL